MIKSYFYKFVKVFDIFHTQNKAKLIAHVLFYVYEYISSFY